MRCPTCGTENAPDSRFCGGCGARLEPPRVAPTFKIPDDAAYPAPSTPPPGSLHAIGHLPTPVPGSLQMPPQPRVASIPPTNPAQAIPGRVASVPPIERPASIPPPTSVPPTERLPSKPPIPPTDVQRPPAPEPSMSMPAVPRRRGALIAAVVIADLGLAAAGGALLFKGLQKPKPAPALKTEALPPPAAAAPAAELAAPAPEIPQPVPKEAAKKAPITKPAPKKKPGGPVDPYGGHSGEVEHP